MKVIKIVAKNELSQNTYLVQDKNTTILIDCGCSIAEVEKEYVKRTNGLNLPKIDAIFLTHTHFDHTLFLKEFEMRFEMPIFVKKGCANLISSPEFNESGRFASSPLTYAPANVVEMEDNQPISIKNITILPIFTPGHSICSTCFLVDDLLFSGDTLFYLAVGRTDLNGSNSDDLEKSLDLLHSLPFSLCYPGHGIHFKKF